MHSLLILSLLAFVCASHHAKALSVLQDWSGGLGFEAPHDDPHSIPHPLFNFTANVDNFHNKSMYEPHSSDTFSLRYYFDDTYYEPGGPVFLLECGEADAKVCSPTLEKGILNILSKATGGLGVVLEHRYFGGSFPTPDLSTSELRFLTTEQALADSVNFAQNIVFPGHEHENLTAGFVPWIAYGVSYSGGMVAFLRTLYPGVFFGAISSSGVTKAKWDYWEYYEPIRKYAPSTCIRNLQLLTNVIDNILFNSVHFTKELKKAFGLPGLEDNAEFAHLLAQPILLWQQRSWDRARGSKGFSDFCEIITAEYRVYPDSFRLLPKVVELLLAAGYEHQSKLLTIPMANYIGYIKTTYGQWSYPDDISQEQSVAPERYDLSDWNPRCWLYLGCSQWGLQGTGSTVPQGELPLVSRAVDTDFLKKTCNTLFNITKPPDTEAINQYGGREISYPRLAFIGGEWDPWRPLTPLADDAHFRRRANDSDQPVLLIEGGGHGWDAGGVLPNETTAYMPPPAINLVHAQEVEFVKAWLRDAKGEFPREL